jgi:hypothetical protein
MEQKIGRIQNELETVDYGDECPFHGENDCAEVRKAYDRGYVNGLYEALTLFKLIEADTPQTDCDKPIECDGCGEHICIGCEHQAKKEAWRKAQTDCGWK